MYKLIEQTESIGYDYLTGFGFDEESVMKLLQQARKDLLSEMTKLENLLDAEDIVFEEVNNVLHALKGLLYQVGNHEVAEQINEIRSHLASQDTLDEIKSLLFDL